MEKERNLISKQQQQQKSSKLKTIELNNPNLIFIYFVRINLERLTKRFTHFSKAS